MTSRAAWGYGLATVAGDGTVLDTWYPRPALGALPGGTDPHIAPAEFEDLEGADERRNVTIDDVGNVAAFLLSDLASGMTAEITYVDCGFNATAGASRDSESVA